MTITEQQLMNEIEQLEKRELELLERLEKQELNFISQLQTNQKNYEKALSQIVQNYTQHIEKYNNNLELLGMNTSKVLSNQKLIYNKLEELNENLTELPNSESLTESLRVISKLHENI